MCSLKINVFVEFAIV